MNEKENLIVRFIGAQCRFIQEMNDLGAEKYEIARALYVTPQRLKEALDMFNLTKKVKE